MFQVEGGASSLFKIVISGCMFFFLLEVGNVALFNAPFFYMALSVYYLDLIY